MPGVSPISDIISDEDAKELARKKSHFDKALNHIFQDVTKSSAAKQVLVGGGAGWVTGYVAVKIGKAAAITVGATVLAIQLAQHKGIIEVNWTKVNRMVKQAQATASENLRNSEGEIVDRVSEVKKFYQNNFFLAAGFSGGFLAGFLF